MVTGFFLAALFFSVIFLWQLISAILGLGGSDEGALDSHVDGPGTHDSPADAHETVATFQLLSVRSILAFCTLFSWAGYLFLKGNVSAGRAMTYSVLWGLAAMVIVSALLYLLRRMTETGNIRIESAVGGQGAVHLDIAPGGLGEIRVACNGIMTHLKAKAAGGAGLKAGTAVRVLKTLDANTVEVEELRTSTEEKKG